ncbi:esterase [Pelagibacteraceae bacterium]|nr:esterase [Pelagibacteraceae bacterium]
MKLNLDKIIYTLKTTREYLFPIKKITSKFSSISSKKELQNFIQERAAHVTQTTLYGYLKTRIGTRYQLMLDDEKYSESVNIAKWNVYMAALSDLTLYVFSYLMDQKKLKQNDAEEIFINIIHNELKNGLSEELLSNTKKEFSLKIKTIEWNKFYLEKPFKNSGLALYDWSPIADDLKVLDKEIVLNSIMLKWNLVENDFKDLTKNLKFN